ncbi:MAG: DUF1801 domain-containing protein [Clostridia bacterium]
MKNDFKNVNEYIESVDKDRKEAFIRLKDTISNNLPNGFKERLSYGMIGYVVPLSIYPKGYHAKKGEPLPFISIASQKRHFAIYHTGIYMDEKLRDWFIKEYAKRVKTKLDMSKSCIRLKYFNDIPYDLIGELCKNVSLDEFVRMYENNRSNK